jgi:lactoylglutathione lyase
MSNPHQMNNLFKSAVKSALLIGVFALPLLGHSQTRHRVANQPVFNHTALCAKDLKRTTYFYAEVLRLQKIKNPFNDTLHTWLKIGPGLALHIIKGDCVVRDDIRIHLCFSVPSLEVFIKHLDLLGIKYYNFNKEPKKIQLRPDGVSQIYFQDPDSNWIEVNNMKS